MNRNLVNNSCMYAWVLCDIRTSPMYFKVVRMVVIRLYVVLDVIYRKLCNGNVTIVGVRIKMSAFYMDVEGVKTGLM